MNRRDFFNVVGASAAVSVLPTIGVFTPESQEWLFPQPMIREIAVYDINRDSYVLRHDIYDGENQYQVSQVIPSSLTQEESLKELMKYRQVSLAELTRYAKGRGMKWEKIQRLPLPEGIDHARYI